MRGGVLPECHRRDFFMPREVDPDSYLPGGNRAKSGVKFGMLLILVGFLMVGSMTAYRATVRLTDLSPQALQEYNNAIATATVGEGVGWVSVGLGLPLALYGMAVDLGEIRGHGTGADVRARTVEPPPTFRPGRMALLVAAILLILFVVLIFIVR